LDAAAACYLHYGVQKTTAANIAAQAGMSRATLYRRYGGRETILLALLTRESQAMAVDAELHLAHVDDPAERMVEGMIFAIAEIRRRPVHAAVFTSERAGWAATQAVSLAALRQLGESGIRPLLGPAPSPGSPGAQLMEDLVDWILRILISYAVMPGEVDLTVDDIRRQLTTLFLPAFERLLARRAATSGR